MTKQGEIRAKQLRLKQVIHEAIYPYLISGIKGGFEVAILEALSGEGVVIKVDRESLKRELTTKEAKFYWELLRAGYTVVGPLT